MNNFERIKQMSVDEIAELLVSYSTDDCDYCVACEFCIEARIGSCRDTLREWLLQECE